MSGGSRVKGRVARSAGSVQAHRDRVNRWLDEHRPCPDFARFTHHFDVLGQVLDAMFDAIGRELDAERDNCHSGRAYERCAELDESTAVAARLFSWYATKYDQRRDSAAASVLHAADELVRSCWSEPFSQVGRTPPTGPLAYLDDRFDAFATPRISVPSDLRAPKDAPVAGFLRELPIPAIALPDYAARQAWWLALAAHETGHHVQKDLMPDLERITRERVAEAVDPGDGALWGGWGLEMFADAYSAAMIGEAAEWAIEELQYSTPATMFRLARAGSRYPPPVVRLAVLEACLRELGLPVGRPLTAQPDWALDPLAGAEFSAVVRETMRAELADVPAVAGALAGLPVGTSELRDLADVQPGVLTDPGQLQNWAGHLASRSPALPDLTEPASARLVMAAGVAAYRKWTAQPAAETVLPVIHENLLALLPACGPPGPLAAAPAPTQVTELAQRLARQLVSDPSASPLPDETES